ncbi:hypothetical protein MNV49_006892 [Pseudohyphozyma bogoriensis]|nr:hypothetical protein MNV49_006892 [Pseudohyphozyma bogoriensis]
MVAVLRPLLLVRARPATTTALRPLLLSSPNPLVLASRPASTLGSGKGGKADKSTKATKTLSSLQKQLEKAKKAKEKVDRDEKRAREQLKAQREKDKLKRDKEKAKAKVQKEKEKVKAAKAKAVKARTKAKVDAKPKVRSTIPKPPTVVSSTWALFVKDYASTARENHTGDKPLTATEIAKLAGPVYRDLSSTEKADLAERVAQLKAEFPAKYDEWLASLSPEDIKEENALRRRKRKSGIKGKATKALKPSDAPKRPLSAYLLFCNAVRNGEYSRDILQGEKSVTEQSKLLGAAYKELKGTEELEPFIAEAQTQKEKYEAALKEFEAKHEHEHDE